MVGGSWGCIIFWKMYNYYCQSEGGGGGRQQSRGGRFPPTRKYPACNTVLSIGQLYYYTNIHTHSVRPIQRHTEGRGYSTQNKLARFTYRVVIVDPFVGLGLHILPVNEIGHFWLQGGKDDVTANALVLVT